MRRLSYIGRMDIFGLMPPTLTGPVHLLQWTSKFNREQVKSSWGREIFALSDMWGHMDMINEFYVALRHEKLRLYGLIDCGSLLYTLRTGRLGAGGFLTRHFRSITDAMEAGDPGYVAWIPGTENPADGLTRVKSEIGPLLNLSWSGAYCPGVLEQLSGASFIGNLD